jgi:hypothetical protein
MARRGLLVCVAICGVAGWNASPASPAGAAGCCVGLFAEGRVDMTFTPQDQTCAEAAEAYRRLWADEGSKIIDAMERGTGLTFLEKHVKAVIFEGPSRSGVGDRPMYLRASYTADVKKAALVHEHGHRLIAQLRESLWGKDFADAQVKIESGRTGLYDYETAWKWARSISKDERASRFADIVKTNRR